MSNDEIVSWLNDQFPPAVKTLGGRALEFDLQRRYLVMSFSVDNKFCHSGDVVQGGYLTGMLDAVMAFAAIGSPGMCNMIATLEIKSSFLRVARAGELQGNGRVLHAGKSIAYMSGELYQEDVMVAMATTTAKLISK